MPLRVNSSQASAGRVADGVAAPLPDTTTRHGHSCGPSRSTRRMHSSLSYRRQWPHSTAPRPHRGSQHFQFGNGAAPPRTPGAILSGLGAEGPPIGPPRAPVTRGVRAVRAPGRDELLAGGFRGPRSAHRGGREGSPRRASRCRRGLPRGHAGPRAQGAYGRGPRRPGPARPAPLSPRPTVTDLSRTCMEA